MRQCFPGGGPGLLYAQMNLVKYELGFPYLCDVTVGNAKVMGYDSPALVKTLASEILAKQHAPHSSTHAHANYHHDNQFKVNQRV